ncbi:scm-like with four MBT domains protein 1 isoform X2 [Heptranchias perlo]|uniref:scm-like with four MBT domains protein 1 isoform X2 n=1 Tax=Heptranchias perlo TaxID=212740 RepID=UPI00355A500D
MAVSGDPDGGSRLDEAQFNWDEYLEETGAAAAPPGSFKHVDTSLRNGFAPGMKLEIANKMGADCYWVATIITTCGQLLLLRYDGFGEDRKADFWCDVMTAELHPIGWSSQNNKKLQPPEAIRERILDWQNFLIHTVEGACSAPANLLEGPNRGKNPLDLISAGSRFELQDSLNPLEAWIVVVEENFGGRLHLRYEGVKDIKEFDQWLFYLDSRLHPLGWAAKQGYERRPPAVIRSLMNEEQWQAVLQTVAEETMGSPDPPQVFKDQCDIGEHSFDVGMKLEAVNPTVPFSISPATITKVYNKKYFLVEIDTVRPDGARTVNSFVCHGKNPNILPVQWCLKHGLHLTSPKGFPGQDFDWADYLKKCGSKAAAGHCFASPPLDHGLEENMKLEAANPLHPAEICVATITKVKGHCIWLHLEGSKDPIPEIIVPAESMEIFPVGWCETNGFSLQPPRKLIVTKHKKIAVVQPEKQVNTPRVSGFKNQDFIFSLPDSGLSNARYCCPKIYFNHRCFSGPHLNKGRITELPQSVGPGNCLLVLKEVLSLLTNAAYKPSRVLRELQLDQRRSPQGFGETLKVKYKGRCYRATVEVVTTIDQVASFCRRTCIKLECCPNLFGPIMVLEKCPENCSLLTKTKYTHYPGKQKNLCVALPPSRPANLEGGIKVLGKRRKRRRSCFIQKKKHSANSVENESSGTPQVSIDGEGDSVSEDTGSEQEEPLDEPEPPSPVLQQSHNLSQPPLDADKRKRKRHFLKPSFFSDNEKFMLLKLSSQKEMMELKLQLESNPLAWSVADVVRFIKSTDCAPLSRLFRDQEIDGQALLLLTLPTVQECMELKLGPAIKLCHHIERLKVAFYQQFAH